MKKALVLLVVVVIAGWLGFRAMASVQENRAAEMQWPSNLGTLDEVPKRFPPTRQSEAATKLVQLAAVAGVELRPRADAARAQATAKTTEIRKALGEYTKAQLERPGDAIEAPPPAVASYLATHEAALNAVRDHLLSGQTLAWDSEVTKGFDAPIPNLLGHMHLHRAFTARAFAKAQAGDPAAWDDLRASWELNRGLWPRPDLLSILIAIASTRMTNVAARKMPLPAPAWLGEMFTWDYVGAVATTQQAEAWTIHNAPAGKLQLSDRLRAPLYMLEEANAIDSLQKYTEEAVRSKACDTDGPRFATARARLITKNPAVPNLVGAWQRLMRFRAEVEATERILQIRAGQMPSAKSQCSDGTWLVTANSIRFSRDIKVPPQGIRFPLEYAR